MSNARRKRHRQGKPANRGRHWHRPTKEAVKAVVDEVDELDLPDGAHWALVHERLGLEYGEVFDYFKADPQFFGVIYLPKNA